MILAQLKWPMLATDSIPTQQFYANNPIPERSERERERERDKETKTREINRFSRPLDKIHATSIKKFSTTLNFEIDLNANIIHKIITIIY